MFFFFWLVVREREREREMETDLLQTRTEIGMVGTKPIKKCPFVGEEACKGILKKKTYFKTNKKNSEIFYQIIKKCRPSNNAACIFLCV